jgi:hemoglobin-like flavoprotein
VTPTQQELVRLTFSKLAVMPEVAAALFYERLFAANPSFRSLFSQDMRVQGVKLMTTLTLVVYNLHQPGQVLPAIRDLGARHVGYGVKLADYDALKEALVWTLEQTLGDDCTSDVRDAWAVCYDELAEEMQAGASGP